MSVLKHIKIPGFIVVSSTYNYRILYKVHRYTEEFCIVFTKDGLADNICSETNTNLRVSTNKETVNIKKI